MSINVGIFGDKVAFESRFIPDYQKLAELVKYWKGMGLRIVLTSGTYDLLHIGHAKYLEKAKELGDVLIVGVDSDEKVRARKGPNRPVVSETERIEILSHLRSVDVITFKNLNDPKHHLITIINPDVLVISKSTGHTDEKIDEIKSCFSGKLVILEPQAQTSTTAKVRMLFTSGANQFAKKLTPQIIELIEKSLKEIGGG